MARTDNVCHDWCGSQLEDVLIADDTAFVRDRFQAALEHAGHKAIAVKSAPELLRE